MLVPNPNNNQNSAAARASLEMRFRQAARSRLIPFCQYMWRGFEPRPHRQLIASALEQCEAGKIKRLMIFCPPQYGKSEIVSRSFPAWYLGRNPDKQIILASYGESLAFNLATDARNKVMDPLFQALFGKLSAFETPVQIARNAKSVREWRISAHKGKMKSAGVGGGITGHPADMFIVDDPVRDQEQADSVLIREKQISWFKSSAYTRLSPDGVMIICMTRWHEADLSGYLLAQQRDGGDLYHVLRLSAKAETREEIAAWCKRNYVTPDRLLVSDKILTAA